jgi:molybdopterin synthase catalytic subunit
LAEGDAPDGREPGTDPETGALVTFSGIVRETEAGRAITHLDYEHYAGMAERELERLVAAARKRWPLRGCAVFHRTGPVAVGEASVIVAVSAGHRAEAFEAARFLIDELKKSVPIWKSAPAP